MDSFYDYMDGINILSLQISLLLFNRSRSNNDLLSIDRNNADTASLHSLPMNSSIACLDDLNSNSGDGEGGRANSSSSVNNIGGVGGGMHFDTASFTSSPLASPINASKGKRVEIYNFLL